MTAQKRRTRKDLLQAATHLIREGRPPGWKMRPKRRWSRATAYRYFPDVEQLLLWAFLDATTLNPEMLSQGPPPEDWNASTPRCTE